MLLIISSTADEFWTSLLSSYIQCTCLRTRWLRVSLTLLFLILVLSSVLKRSPTIEHPSLGHSVNLRIACDSAGLSHNSALTRSLSFRILMRLSSRSVAKAKSCNFSSSAVKTFRPQCVGGKSSRCHRGPVIAHPVPLVMKTGSSSHKCESRIAVL